MKQQDYHCAISASITAKEALEKIGDVSAWWTKSFTGNSKKPGDTFSIRFGETFVDFKIVEAIPDKKVVWEVTDCNLHWIKNKTEWKNTHIVWEVFPENSKTNISMTHVGLVTGAECYKDCKVGWDNYIQKSLFNFLMGNKGLPDTF